MLTLFSPSKFLGLFLVVLCSCISSSLEEKLEDSVQMEQSTESLELVLVDTLSFELDEYSSAKSWLFQFKIIDNKPYYLTINNAIHSLQVYQLESKEMFKRIRFDKTGPQANVLNENFYFHNWDSIFFFSNSPNKIMLFDSAGVKKQEYYIKLNKEHEDYHITTMEYYFKPYFYNQTVGFWMVPDFSPNKNEFYAKSVAIEYDLANSSYKTYGFFPKNYLQTSGSYMVLLSMNHYALDSFHILYFGASPNVYLFNKGDKSLHKSIALQSKFLEKEIDPLYTKENDNYPTIEEREIYYLTTGFYEYMFTNESHSYHYRIVKHSNELQYPNGETRNRNDFSFSIMILDKNFNYINEIAFPGKKFDYKQSFAFENKLYININNPLNLFADEDQLMFAVYELRSKKTTVD